MRSPFTQVVTACGPLVTAVRRLVRVDMNGMREFSELRVPPGNNTQG